MSYYPDCRTDGTYNEKYLNERDKSFVDGFDWCAERAVDNLFDNLDILEDDDLQKFLEKELPYDPHEDYDWVPTFDDGEKEHREIKTYGDYLRLELINYIEAERDVLITSMIDNMDEEEYEKNKRQCEGND